MQDVVPFGKENGEPVRLEGIFHPAGETLTVARSTKSHVQRVRDRLRARGQVRLLEPVLLGGLNGGGRRPQRLQGRRHGSSAPSSLCSLRCWRSPSRPGWSRTTAWPAWTRCPGAALGALGFYVTVWVVMMAAMMFPSVAPTVLMYDRLREGHRAAGRGAAPDATALFVAGLPRRLDGGGAGRLRPARAAGREHRPGLPGLGRRRPLADRRRDRGGGASTS